MVIAIGLAAWLMTAAQGAAAAAPPLTLQEAIAAARQSSPLRKGAAERASGALDAARASGRLPNPLFDFRTENWTPSSARVLPLDVWATVSQPIELSGKRALRRALADAAAEESAATLTATDQQLTVQTARLYVGALRARGLLANLQANREGLNALLEAMRHRVGEGYAAEADLLRFESEAARVDIDITRATVDLGRRLDELTVLIGAPARISADQLVLPDVAVPLPAIDPAAIAAGIARHPELKAAEARLATARQNELLERARRLPDPAVTAGYKRTAGISTVVGAITTTIPLFDRNASARAAAAAEVRAAAAERDAVHARLLSEATALAAAATALADRAERANTDLLPPADAVREAARAAFAEGLVDVLKLIDAERVYGEVRRTALDLRLEALAASIEARIAVGEEPLP